MESLENIKKWWLRNIYGIGKKVYWDNRDDARFSGEYILTTKRDKNGYVGIYNEKVGDRVVPYYYLDPAKRD
jgi:hypothetical protein